MKNTLRNFFASASALDNFLASHKGMPGFRTAVKGSKMVVFYEGKLQTSFEPVKAEWQTPYEEDLDTE